MAREHEHSGNTCCNLQMLRVKAGHALWHMAITRLTAETHKRTHAHTLRETTHSVVRCTACPLTGSGCYKQAHCSVELIVSPWKVILEAYLRQSQQEKQRNRETEKQDWSFGACCVACIPCSYSNKLDKEGYLIPWPLLSQVWTNHTFDMNSCVQL